MRHFFRIIVGLALLLPTLSTAEFTNQQKAFLEPKNFLENPGAEAGKLGLTASAGTFAVNTTAANVFVGSAAWSWDASASSQTLRTGLKQLPVAEACIARVRYKGGDANLTFKVLDASANVLASQVLSVSTNYQQVLLPFPCPASGTTSRISIESTADAAIAYFDDWYLGSNYYLGMTSNAQFVGQAYIATTLNCTPARTNTALGAFTLDTDCPGPTIEASTIGDWQTTDTDLPKFTVNNLPPGIYEVVATIPITVASSGTGCVAVNDGTTTSGTACYQDGGTYVSSVTAVAYFSYSAAGNRTFEIYGSASSGAITLDASGALRRPQISIRRFPSTNDQALLLSQTGWRIDANISGANPSLGTSSVSAYAGVENGSLTLTQNAGSATAWIPCSSTNDSSGTTCSAGNESVGVSFTPPFAGDFRACVSFSNQIDLGTAGATGAIDTAFEIVETPNAAQTISQEGKSRIQSGKVIQNTNQREIQSNPNQLCGTFTFSTIGRKTLRLFYEQAIAATISASVVLGDSDASYGQRDIHWEVYPLVPWTQNPLVNNSMINSSAGVTRTEAAKLNCDSGAAITSQQGAWVSSIGNVSSGACIATLTAGIFSSAPWCVASDINVASAPVIVAANASSATSVTIDCADNAGAACTAYDVNLICVGPR